jgi:TetR/AcrR family transcriptional repressor of nem operon
MTVILYIVKCGDTMRVTKDQMVKSRLAILKAAGKLFRKRGFEGVTVAEVMEAAGLTHGAFYSYFTSKQDLIAETLEASVESKWVQSAPSIGEYAGQYLSKKHRDDFANGCVFASLGSDVARSNAELRHALTGGLKTQLAKLEEHAHGKSVEDKRQSAITAWATMVGALMLSRISDDKELSDEILERTTLSLTQ